MPATDPNNLYILLTDLVLTTVKWGRYCSSCFTGRKWRYTDLYRLHILETNSIACCFLLLCPLPFYFRYVIASHGSLQPAMNMGYKYLFKSPLSNFQIWRIKQWSCEDAYSSSACFHFCLPGILSPCRSQNNLFYLLIIQVILNKQKMKLSSHLWWMLRVAGR